MQSNTRICRVSSASLFLNAVRTVISFLYSWSSIFEKKNIQWFDNPVKARHVLSEDSTGLCFTIGLRVNWMKLLFDYGLTWRLWDSSSCFRNSFWNISIQVLVNKGTYFNNIKDIFSSFQENQKVCDAISPWIFWALCLDGWCPAVSHLAQSFLKNLFVH